MYYCEHDNSMNFCMDDDSRLEVCGIEPRAMFMAARNALASKDPITNYILGKTWEVESAKEMITALQAFVDKHTTKEDDQQ